MTASRKSQFDYSVWIEPFPLNIWMLFIISFILVPFLVFKKGVGNKLEGIFSLLSWQSVSMKNSKFVIILSFAAMFVSTFYCNEITSLMVVPVAPQPIQNLKEILDIGYKFVVIDDVDFPHILKTYEEDFRQFNVSDRLNTSFYHVPNIEAFTLAIKYLADAKTKYAAVAEQDNEFYSVLLFNTHISTKLGDGTMECQYVSKGIRPASIFRIFYTINRYWLFQTLQQIKDAGLDAKWKDWFDWECFFAEQVRTRGYEGGGLGLIEMAKFTPIFVLWAFVGLIGFVIFVVEVLAKSRILSQI